MLRGKTWAGLAKAMGGISPIYATAALCVRARGRARVRLPRVALTVPRVVFFCPRLGQMRLTEKEAHAAAQELQLVRFSRAARRWPA